MRYLSRIFKLKKGPAPSLTEHHVPVSGRARFSAGFTLLEFLITFAILIMISGIIATFTRDLLVNGMNFEESFLSQSQSRAVLTEMISEIREAMPSDLGGYPIEIAEGNSIAFYANIDNDSLRERVQYFMSGTNMKKSVIKPVGSPLTYSTTTATENLRTVLNNVQALASTTPIFGYRSRSTATSTNEAVTIDLIRLVAIKFLIDEDPTKLPAPFVGDGAASLRYFRTY